MASSIFPCFNLGKSLFLVLNDHVPVKTELQSSDGKRPPRLVVWFNADATRHARIYQRLMDHTLDVQSASGEPISPAALTAYSDSLWDEYEAEVPA